MPHYKAAARRTAGAAVTVGSLGNPGSSPRRPIIDTIAFGSEATPAEVAMLCRVQRCTALGTSTAVTPQLNDPADVAAVFVVGENHTIEPTYTANAFLLTRAVHQRACVVWTARDDQDRLVIPATNSNGVGLITPVLNGGTPAVSFEFGATE